MTYKKNPINENGTVCNLWISSRSDRAKYEKYTGFRKLENDIDTSAHIYWSEFNYWYITFVFVPVPMFGFIRESEGARINLVVWNNRAKEIRWRPCDAQLRSENGKQFPTETKCASEQSVIILPNTKYEYDLIYSGPDFKNVSEIVLHFNLSENGNQYKQNLDIPNYWEFCSVPALP